MAHLTKPQTEFIREDIEQRGISHPELAENLLDHICSAVESAMESGESFDQAYTRVMRSFGKNELKQVQVKTQALEAGEKIYYPDIKQSAGLLLLYFILVLMSGFIIKPVINFYWHILGEHIFLIQTLQVSVCLLLVIAFARYELRERGFTRVDLFPLNPFPLTILPIIFWIQFLWSIWMEIINSWIPLSDSMQAYIDAFLSHYPSVPVCLLLIVLWPLLSEILFRGIMLKGLLRKYTPLQAILCSSIFFSVILLNPYDALSLFSRGLFCGWLFYRTRSLLPSILVQILSLLPGAVYITWTKPQHHEQLLIWKNLIANDTVYYGLGMASLLLTIFLLWRLKKLFDKQQPVVLFSIE